MLAPLYRLSSWQNLREKLALQVHALKVELRKELPIPPADELLLETAPLSARGESCYGTEVLMSLTLLCPNGGLANEDSDPTQGYHADG